MTGRELPLLRVRGLTRRYGDTPVVAGLDLDLAAGAALALVGRNGAGKSTVLRCVAGHDRPDEGEVLLAGEPVDERSPRTRRAVATLLEDLDFFPDLTVVEHLDLLASAHDTPQAQDTVDAVLDEVGLGPLADRLPGSLSSGQRRRLALASVLVRPRRVLVLDEPEQRLDTAGVAWLAERLRREKVAGVGVLLASHDAELVSAVADTVVDLGQ